MATVSNVVLEINPNPSDIAQLNLEVEYDINFDTFDITTDLRYAQRCVLIGVDAATDGPAAEGDDTLRTFRRGSVSAGGASVLHRSETFSVPRTLLDEDRPPIPNPDELRMRCEVHPMLPVPSSGNSNVETVNLP